MSIYPSPDKLDSKKSKYALVILAAKRAKQIREKARVLIDSTSANPLTLALEELAEGAIIERVVEDPAVAAHIASLAPHEPSLEDIIGAGPVSPDPEPRSHARRSSSHAAALRNAEPETEDDEAAEDEDEEPQEVFPLDSPVLAPHNDEESSRLVEIDGDADDSDEDSSADNDAGPVLPDAEPKGRARRPSSQAAALRNAEPEVEDDEVTEGEEEPQEVFPLDSPVLAPHNDEESSADIDTDVED